MPGVIILSQTENTMEKWEQPGEGHKGSKPSIPVLAESMKSYFRSKYDIYMYLKEMKQLYLPSYEDTKLCKRKISSLKQIY